MTPQVFIFGAGPQGRVILDILRSGRAVDVGGFLDDHASVVGNTVSGLPVIDAAEWLASAPNTAGVVVAIGKNDQRTAAGRRVAAAGIALYTAIHSSAVIAADVQIGAGSVVCMQTGIGTGCRLGINVVINTGTTLDHDSVVDDGAYLSPGVRSAGGVRVGANAFIGVGAVLLPGVRIGSDAVVGAGSIVLADIPDRALVHGVPARLRRIVDGSLDWSRILGGRKR